LDVTEAPNIGEQRSRLTLALYHQELCSRPEVMV
jgi:hypothetical protein